MKNISFLLALVCTVLFSVTSCSDENFGIDYELVSPEDLTFAPGDSATFIMKVTSESGIDQINISEQTIPFTSSTLFRPFENNIDLTFTAQIPEDQEDGSELEFNVQILEREGNIYERIIEVSIEE